MNEKEHLEWLEEREKKLELIEKEIIKFQDKINNSAKTPMYSDYTREELEESLSNAKMAIFELWYLQYKGKKYGE